MSSLSRNFELSERESVELTAAGSAGDILVSTAAILAALVGLTGTTPISAASCAVIAIGAGLLFEGGAIAARFLRSLKRNEEDSLTKGDVWGGMTADLVAGAGGIVLGALGLFNIAPMSVLGTAVLVYSSALLLGCAALVHATTTVRDGVPLPSLGLDVILLAAGAQLVAGLVTLALGIIALLGAATLPLTLVSLLIIGVSELLSGLAVGSKMMRMLRTT